MRKISVKLPTLYRNGLFAVFFASWCSGVIFFILSRWMMVEGDFGPEKHPWQYPVLQLHGAAAFLMMIVFGSIIAAHLPASWSLNRMRIIGSLMIGVVSLQIITAYGLYYLSDEQIRHWVANMHAAVGVTLPLVLIFHLVMGVKTRRRRT